MQFDTPQPVVAVTMYGRDEGNRLGLPADYTDALVRCGALPLLVPPVPVSAAAMLCEMVLDHVDGVLLTGGGDIDPTRYGAITDETVRNVDLERDALECAMARAACRRNKPLFGICRGLQILNVVRGGTLHVDLPKATDGSVLHRIEPREITFHKVSLDEPLQAMLGSATIAVPSLHHQGIKKLGSGLQPCAISADGLIEAIYDPALFFCLAVQWHPETTAATDSEQAALFEAFVAACQAQGPALDSKSKSQ